MKKPKTTQENTNKSKKIKDPLYGYINIPTDIFDNIINTPEFQRLKNIRQTSYESLYPNALHNRFVHSLGVYYLATLAANSFFGELNSVITTKKLESKLDCQKIQQIQQIFELAALLHDIGHAPFSHTLEDRYKDAFKSYINNDYYDYKQIDALIIEKQGYTNNSEFSPAPHEQMSCIVCLQIFKDQIDDQYIDFFLRCILGIQYYSLKENDYEKIIMNWCIQMLNCDTIDVDRLDYVMRDCYFSGYNNVNIDYKRFLESMHCHIDKDNYLMFSYNQRCITEIEKIFVAFESEKKWVQHHNTIIYENFILENIVNLIDKDKKLFCYEALTQQGIQLSNANSIRLLSDSDILFLIKQKYDFSVNKEQPEYFIAEYFDRNKRRTPLWKTESEFKVLFRLQQKECRNSQSNDMYQHNMALLLKSNCQIINETALADLQSTSNKDKQNITKAISILQKIKECIQKYSCIDFDLAIAKDKPHTPNYYKIQKTDIYIQKTDTIYPFQELSSVINSEDKNQLQSNNSQNVYFIYARKRDNCDKQKVKQEIDNLAKDMIDILTEG